MAPVMVGGAVAATGAAIRWAGAPLVLHGDVGDVAGIVGQPGAGDGHGGYRHVFAWRLPGGRNVIVWTGPASGPGSP